MDARTNSKETVEQGPVAQVLTRKEISRRSFLRGGGRS
jgi:hypothetical protein